ncbi:aspartate aminotransferase family protein [Candidatus Litorirhabdus singularis]|uniref:aspartate aminotransferase family protein n=1 Tax=Candidatus Litorirhabdus singularis TaxID=2518993 RepID=UPI002A4E20EA|nr:aspartate aminotransferase family protein [Candidatus Litorirhabdus singularis]
MSSRTTRSSSDWQQLDQRHYLHPFSDFKALGQQGSQIISRAEGIYIYDNEGRQILDGMSGLWCCSLGYGQQSIAAAVYAQLQELPYYNSFFQCAHPPVIELSQRLAEVAPKHMNNVFFTSSGSEANDTCLRLLRRYWDLAGKPSKRLVISRRNAYHGSTIAGASLGGMGFMHQQFETLSYVHHVDQPYWFDEGGDMEPEAFGLQAARSLELKIDELGAENVAAFIAEPIQGAGGVIVPPASYWPEIERICRAHDILLITDEVICGFGRTGEWFGADYFSVSADLMPFAKAVTNGYQPLGGVLVSDRCADVLKTDGGEFAHGYTYSGHPAACAAALATLDILQEQNIVTTVRDSSGPYLQRRWAELAEHPLVGETRGAGFLAALELVSDKASRARFDGDGSSGARCRDNSMAAGLVMRAVGDTMIVAPPLVATHAQIDELIDKARAALDATAAELI